MPAEFLVIPERTEQGEESGRGKNEDVDQKNVTLLTHEHQNSTSVPPSTVSTTSPSPRIGGRSRTDTMYLSEGYVSPHSRGSPVTKPSSSPQRIPSPITAMLDVDANQKGEELSITRNDATEGVMAQAEDGMVDVLEKEGVDRTVESDEKEGAVLPRTHALVIARDFALEAPLPVTGREPPADGTEDVPCHIEEMETKRGDTSSSLGTLGEPSDPELLQPIDIPTVPSESADPIPAPSYSEIAVAEPPLPAIPSDMEEPQASSEVPSEDENDVDPVLSEEVPSEEPERDEDIEAGAEDVVKGIDELKEEEIAPEIKDPLPTVDTQQDSGEGNVDENTEKIPEGGEN